jgi:hypothetical protein
MGVGEMEVLPCANPSVLAYMRSGEVADILTTAPSSHGANPHGRSPGELEGADWERTTVMARTVPAGNEGPGTRWCGGSRPCSACTT